MIEAFLAKIVGAVFKKAMFSTALTSIATAYEVCSVFDAVIDASDCIESLNTCSALEVHDLPVISDVIADVVVDNILKIGSDTFVVEKTASGIYAASRSFRDVKLPGVEWLTVRRGEKGSFSGGGKHRFGPGKRGSFSPGHRGSYDGGGRR